jgi:hypothetical protein
MPAGNGAPIHLGAAVTAIDAGCHDGAHTRGRCRDPQRAASLLSEIMAARSTWDIAFLQLERDLCAGVGLEGRLDPRTSDQIRHCCAANRMRRCNHGDEYEGQVALGKLIRSLEAEEVCGRIIILPSANFPAAMAGMRISPRRRQSQSQLSGRPLWRPDRADRRLH